jgi:hypothetical protein
MLDRSKRLSGATEVVPWRLERMALAVALALFFALGAAQLASWALTAWTPYPQGYLRAAVFGCAASALAVLALGFVCAFAIKLPGSSAAARRWKQRGQRAAHACLGLGLALGLPCCGLLLAYQLRL